MKRVSVRMRLLYAFGCALPFLLSSCKGVSTYETIIEDVVEDSSSSESDPSDSGLVDSVDSEDSEDSSASVEVATTFSIPPAGFYESFELSPAKSEKGGVVRCSFDGSEPTEETAVFEEPRRIDSTTIVSCYEFVDSTVVEKSTQTYFINESLTMPVVSIRVAPEYVREYLDIPSCSYEECPRIWDDTEYPIHLEYFAEGSRTKTKSFEINAGISVSGGLSRKNAKRSVCIYIRKQYQKSRLNYPLFDTRPEKSSFKSFVLRSGGTRFISDYVGDAVATSVLEGTTLDYQRSRLVVVFYNGVFHGIYDLRERLNEQFVQTNHGIDADNVEILKHIRNGLYVSNGSTHGYMEMLAYVNDHQFDTEADAYDSLKKLMDIENYADYMATEIYYRNLDWPFNNVRVWRTANQPWKFAVFDLDLGMDWGGNVHYSMNFFDWIRNGGFLSPNPEVEKNEALYFHNIYKKVIVNKDFRRLFLNRASILYHQFLNSERIKQAVDAKVAELGDEEVSRDQAMYQRQEYTNYCGGGFSISGLCIKAWVERRDEWVREEIIEEFGLPEDVEVSISAEGNGSVFVEGMELLSKNYKGVFFGGTGMLLLAKPANGASFKSWEDGSTENPRLIEDVKDGDSFKAVFN